MLVYKDGDNKKDILGFRCDLCDSLTLTDVIPNKHGEFHYTCPKCKHRMKEVPETTKEETSMVNTYTVANAAKRLNCSTSTINRAIQDGRFRDCFMDSSHTGRHAWMIPSDQVEEWVSKGGFLQMGKMIKGAPTKAEMEAFQKSLGKLNGTQKAAKVESQPVARTVFDPEKGKEVEVLNLLGDIPIDPNKDSDVPTEFQKRVVRRVAKNPKMMGDKFVKVLDLEKPAGEVVTERNADGKPIAGRYPWGEDDKMETEKVGKAVNEILRGGDTDGDVVDFNKDTFDFEKAAEENLKAIRSLEKEVNHELMDRKYESFIPANPGSVVRTNSGFSITIPTELVEEMVQKQIRQEISGSVNQLRTAFDLLNEELKKLEEAIA